MLGRNFHPFPSRSASISSSQSRVEGTVDDGGKHKEVVARAGDAVSARGGGDDPPRGGILISRSVQPPLSITPAVEGVAGEEGQDHC